MATAIKFTRNRPPHFAGDHIGTDPVTADRLIKAGLAVKFDLAAAARATAKPEAEATKESEDGKPAEAKGAK